MDLSKYVDNFYPFEQEWKTEWRRLKKQIEKSNSDQKQ